MQKIQIIDSHTGGEPTRLVVGGGPDLGQGSLADQVEVFRSKFDDFRKSVVLEPRGSDVHVGALLCEPLNPANHAGVIFFNNTGYLQMCGHGTIGLAVSLVHMGRESEGTLRIETPVGVVLAEVLDQHSVRIQNVDSYRYQKHVEVDVPGYGLVSGDIAWGGNWFFLVNCPDRKFQPDQISSLLTFSSAIRKSLDDQGITGENGGLIDHIELYQHVEQADDGIDAAEEDNLTGEAVNFVLCPGGAWDRSPCGTGTSAKLACLAADGLLQPGQTWKQTSVIGSSFYGTYEMADSFQAAPDGCKDSSKGPVIVPSITGQAWVSAESTLLIAESDPFAAGIPLFTL